jgi:hypothetical protein
MDQRYYGLRRQALQLAIRNGLKRPFNKKNQQLARKSLGPFLKDIQYCL